MGSRLRWEIDEREIRESFVRASGPGGQNVNKVSTAVQLRYDIARSSSLPADVKERLTRLGGKRVTEDGVLIIEARRFRSQDRNRQDARDRLAELVGRASTRPKRRRRTHPTPSSRERRLEAKHLRGEVKRRRKSSATGPE